MGHFSLDDNMRTNYQARELKTVYLEQYCQYLKIVMTKCHLNNFNIFNQVGIVSINCIGSYMGEYEVGMITNKIIHQPNPALPQDQDPTLIPRNMRMSTLSDKDLDPTIQDKLKTLNNAK